VVKRFVCCAVIHLFVCLSTALSNGNKRSNATIAFDPIPAPTLESIDRESVFDSDVPAVILESDPKDQDRLWNEFLNSSKIRAGVDDFSIPIDSKSDALMVPPDGPDVVEGLLRVRGLQTRVIRRETIDSQKRLSLSKSNNPLTQFTDNERLQNINFSAFTRLLTKARNSDATVCLALHNALHAAYLLSSSCHPIRGPIKIKQFAYKHLSFAMLGTQIKGLHVCRGLAPLNFGIVDFRPIKYPNHAYDVATDLFESHVFFDEIAAKKAAELFRSILFNPDSNTPFRSYGEALGRADSLLKNDLYRLRFNSLSGELVWIGSQ
jgi:hypothetical protein